MAYDLSVSKARDPLIAITVFAAIGIATTALRLKSRQMRQIALGIDDWFMLAALVCLTSYPHNRELTDGSRRSSSSLFP